MKDGIQKTLNEVIDIKLRNLVSLSFNSEERSNAIRELTELYKLRIEESKIDQVAIEIANKEVENDREWAIKREQLKNQTLDRYFSIGIQIGLAVGGWIVYDIWNRRGLKFEETGTITSPWTRNLISRMLPKK